jgi:leucyl-tRNA---protein transferase
MADTLNNSGIPEDDRNPDIALYEGTCIFNPEKNIKLAAFYIYRCTNATFDYFLDLGYRKFAYRFFRYVCDCTLCSSIRVLAQEYSRTKTHRRIIKKNEGMAFRAAPLEYREEHYLLYKTHHENRGFKALDEDMFVQEFYFSPVNGFVTEIYDSGKLVGLGFIDEGAECLSSVYFVYDPQYFPMSPGIFSIIKEIELAQSMGKKHYYLGLYCKGQRFLGYKDRFSPYEALDYATGIWNRVAK